MTGWGRQETLGVCYCSPRPISSHKLVNPALLVAIYDGSECGGQVGQRIDCIEFACFDGDGRPSLSPSILACEERVLAIEGYPSDGSLDGVAVNLDPTVTQEDAQAVPVFRYIASAAPSGDLPATRGR